MDDEALQRIYQWVDEIPLARPKRNISRDFADGVLMAEMVAHYFPKLVEMHNYPPANSYAQKMYNWCVKKKAGAQLILLLFLAGTLTWPSRRGGAGPHSTGRSSRRWASRCRKMSSTTCATANRRCSLARRRANMQR